MNSKLKLNRNIVKIKQNIITEITSLVCDYRLAVDIPIHH